MIRTWAVFIIFYCDGVLAVTHSLKILHTEFVQEQNPINFTAVGLVNGVQFLPFHGNYSWMIRTTESEDMYWTQCMQGESEDFKFWWSTINKDDYFNHTQGVHTVQWRYSCELNDDNTTRGKLQYAYDGEEFMFLNLELAIWNTSSSIKSKWDMERKTAQYWKHFLEIKCINFLREFTTRSREFLDKKISPTASLFQNCSTSPEVVCHATGFLPKAVMISWKKDGEDVHKDVELRETLPNQDGSFQKRCILKVSAEELQKHNYTCVIQHSSLEKVLPVSERQILRDEGLCGDLAGDSAGVTIGLIVSGVFGLVCLAAVGFFVWKKCVVRKKNQEVQQNGTELHPLNISPSDTLV